MNCLIVCPTYGRVPFLNRMLASFASQTYQQKELVIINDDVNVTIDCDYPNVTCINLNKKILLPQKRNLANNLGYHDLIMQHDDDDIFLPKRLENHVKKFRDNPFISLYRNEASYITYEDEFKVESNSPTSSSYLKKAWYGVGGYSNNQTIGEDWEFYNKMSDKLIERDEMEIDYVYNWGGINYHSSLESHETIEKKAFRQLEEMNLVGKTFKVEPDFEQYKVFLELDLLYKETKQPIRIQHLEIGKICLQQ